MSDEHIEEIRNKIDDIDSQLLALLNERARLVLDLAESKIELGLPLFDPGREKLIFEHVTGKNPGPLSRDAVTRLFERVIDESRRLERTEVYDKKDKE